ncbi:MAG: endonuclease domain-containing protein [Myxococcales bacterium]
MVKLSSRQSSFAVTQLKGRAAVKRHHLTTSEAALRQRLRRSQLGVAFRRQVPLANYIVDLLAPPVRIIVEVDGLWHQGQRRNRRVSWKCTSPTGEGRASVGWRGFGFGRPGGDVRPWPRRQRGGFRGGGGPCWLRRPAVVSVSANQYTAFPVLPN